MAFFRFDFDDTTIVVLQPDEEFMNNDYLGGSALVSISVNATYTTNAAWRDFL